MESWFLVLCLTITVTAPVTGVKFQFPAFNSCVILDTDATFNLTVHQGNQQRSQTFDLSGATIAPSSSCITPEAPTLLDLLIFPYGDKLSLSFRDVLGQIYLYVYYQINTHAHFPVFNSTLGPVLDDSIHLHVGTNETSFKCNSPEVIVFNKDVASGYYMTMNLRNTQLQAFNVKGSTFSPATVCEQDIGSTTEPPETTATVTAETIEPETSPTETTITAETIITETMPSETTATVTAETIVTETSPAETVVTETTPAETVVTETTPAETTPEQTTSPGPPVTTVSPTPPTNTYRVEEDGIVCLVMKAAIELEIAYNATNGGNIQLEFANDPQQSMTQKIPIPRSAENRTTGRCGKDENILVIPFFENWYLNLTVDRETSNSLLTMMSVEEDVKYSWRTISLIYTEDEQHFPGIKTPSNTPITKSETFQDGYFGASNISFFQCNASTDLKLNDSVHMTLSDFQYRAFGENNKTDFPNSSGDVVVCKTEKPDDSNDDELTIAIVIGSCLGGICVALAIVYMVARLRKKRNARYQELEPSTEARFHQRSNEAEPKTITL